MTGPFQAQFVAGRCSLAGQNSTYLSALTTLSVGSQSILINSIPADSSCTITETLDAAPAGYAWTQVLPTAPLTVVAGQAVHAPITNTLAAIPPTVGSIRVNKTRMEPTVKGMAAGVLVMGAPFVPRPPSAARWVSPCIARWRTAHRVSR